MNAVYVLWLRHVKRYFRSRSRLLSSLGQPLMYLASLGFGLGPIFQRAGLGSYLQFLTPGVIGMTILYSAVFAGGDVIWDRQFGYLKATLVAPAPRFMIMIGKTLGGATTAMIQGLIVISICSLFGFRPVSFAALLFAFAFMVLIALLFTALGTALACVVSDFQGFQMVTSFLVMPMFMLSGALYPLAHVSKALHAVARIDPFAYGVDGLRSVLIGNVAHFGLFVDLSILIVMTAFVVSLGGYFFSRIQLSTGS